MSVPLYKVREPLKARRQALVSCDEEPLKCIAGTILVLIIKLIARAKDLRGIVPLH